MGLIPADQVRPLRLLEGTGDNWSLKEKITITQVIQACGNRLPAAGSAPTTFRQVFVAVTASDSPSGFVAQVNALRLDAEKDFHRATGQRATVVTSLN
jgi:hypothetical protein